ncbi:MAG: S49 family peptidase [Xanthobacteraceae bacterium]|nr:S49 family peptidase [Xanthobacteraceae bacterium]
MTILAHIADRIINQPLLIKPEKLPAILAALEDRLPVDVSALIAAHEQVQLASNADRHPAEFIPAEFIPADRSEPENLRKPYQHTRAGTAVIPIVGSLVHRGSWIDPLSGLVSYERIKYLVSTAVADPEVHSIILDMHTPGGEAVGAFEAADFIRAASATKPIYAMVNGMAASAGYALAAASTKVLTTKSGLSGSIGVVLVHTEHSRRLDKAGIAVRLIFAGDRKVDGNPFEPLREEVADNLQREVDDLYELFVLNIAGHRPQLSAQIIRNTQARVYLGRQAVDAGLADEVSSLEGLISDLDRASPIRLRSIVRQHAGVIA